MRELLEKNAHEIAAVITEPYMCDEGPIMPQPGYLEGLRKLTEEYGVLLIFDEVITGFRLALGGAQEYFWRDTGPLRLWQSHRRRFFLSPWSAEKKRS